MEGDATIPCFTSTVQPSPRLDGQVQFQFAVDPVDPLSVSNIPFTPSRETHQSAQGETCLGEKVAIGIVPLCPAIAAAAVL